MPVPVIYQDEYMLVVDKPAGLVVDKSETQTVEVLADILQRDFGIDLERGGIVHRLDKDTSGLLLVAKTQEVLEQLQAQFKARQVKKEYLALVHGVVEKGGFVKGAIMRNPGDREKFIVSEGGKEAETGYKLISNFKLQISDLQRIFEGFNKIQMRKLEESGYGNFTLLRCFPLTGRTHQIRVHLKHIGHSIVGDSKYGGRRTARLDYRWCRRQFLHAARIEFDHPQSGGRLSFESPLPDDLSAALKNLIEINVSI